MKHLLSTCVALLAGAPLAQSPPPPVDLAAARAAVRAAEAERIAVMRRVAPSVAAVMSLTAPGGGSGVVIDPRGFVLTNFHVVGKPDVSRMKVGLPDGELHGATVLGIDPGSDLAVLLLDARPDGSRDFPHAEIGDSIGLLVGEHVFAMGNPFLLATDFQPTVTWGIVSGTRRYQPGGGNRMLVYPDCIQVDAPVNPGNSGGPLFDMDGRVVGINGRISIQDQRGRVNVGIGFAIASHQIRNFLPDLMAGRFAEHGTLDLNAWFMDTPDGGGSGVYVQSMFDDSAVRAFGVGLGDELTRLNGAVIRSANQLATLVGVLPAGSWVELGSRPRTESGGFGPETLATFPLRRLDTGSSRAEDRLAELESRRLAAAALAEPVGHSAEPAPGARLAIEGPAGLRVVLHRRGDMLRIDQPDHALVWTGSAGFRIEADGRVVDLDAAAAAKLRTILATNPWLWRGADLRRALDGGALLGGAMVFGEPAFRIALAGDDTREMWFGYDGVPLGCAYDDPVQDARIELRRRGDRGRIVKDGALATGWTVGEPVFETPDASLFERPAR